MKPSDAQEAGSTSRAPRPLKVLVVEDEALIALSLEDLLQRLGLECCGLAVSATAATVAALADPPDIAIIDVNLRDGRTGIDLAERLATELGTVIILATANTEDAPPGDTLAALVKKPYLDSDIIAALRVAVERLRRD